MKIIAKVKKLKGSLLKITFPVVAFCTESQKLLNLTMVLTKKDLFVTSNNINKKLGKKNSCLVKIDLSNILSSCDIIKSKS